MWLFILLLRWVTGTVMSTNPSSKYTILEWDLEFTDCTVTPGMARFQFPRGCMEHLHQRTGDECSLMQSMPSGKDTRWPEGGSACLRFEGVLAKKPNVSRSGGCWFGTPD